MTLVRASYGREPDGTPIATLGSGAGDTPGDDGTELLPDTALPPAAPAGSGGPALLIALLAVAAALLASRLADEPLDR